MGAKHDVIPKVNQKRRKRIPMLTGLKMSSLAYKYVFYRSEHNAKGERSWNADIKNTNGKSSKSRWEKWGHFFVIMCTPRVIIIKMSKIAHFLYFLLMTAKSSHSWDKIFKCIWKISLSSFSKMICLIGFGLREKYPNTEFFLVCIFLYSD